MAKIMRSPKLSSQMHLASILRDYLQGKEYVTEKRLESEIHINHSREELKEILDNPIFKYLLEINPETLDYLKRKFSIE